MADQLLSPEQLATETGVSVLTLKAWRYRGEGPAFIKAGRRVLYRRSDVDRWLDAHRTEAAS